MRTRLAFLFVLLCIFTPLTTFAQKVKYKDLFLLLQAKKYDDALPFLNTFLTQKPDFANAHYQKGILYQYKAYHTDVLKAQDTLNMYADTARQYFATALQLITEKEVKKRDEYYQQFNRRDLRTGKFGIKVSDVHADITSRTTKLGQYADSVKLLNDYFNRLKAYYDSASAQYQTIYDQYQQYNTMLLRHDSTVQSQWEQLNAYYQSYRQYLGNYTSVITGLGTTGYNQAPNTMAIEGLPALSGQMPDFYAAAPEVFDYSGWVMACQKEVKEQLTPLRQQLVQFDEAMAARLERAATDTTVKAFDRVPAQELENNLLQYDDNPFPFKVFAYKAACLQLQLSASPVHNKILTDSLHLDSLVSAYRQLIDQGRQADSLLLLAQGAATDQKLADYAHFIRARYQSPAGLRQYFNTQKTEQQAQAEALNNSLNYFIEKSRWATVGADSVPMYVIDEDLEPRYFRYTTKYKTHTDSLLLVSGLLNQAQGEVPALGFLAYVLESREVVSIDSFDIQFLRPEIAIDSMQVMRTVHTDGSATVLVFRQLEEHQIEQLPDSSLTRVVCLQYDSTLSLTNQTAFGIDDVPVKTESDPAKGYTTLYYIDTQTENAGQLQKLVINKEGVLKED